MNKKLMTMGLAALMLAGCSSDDLVTEEGQGVAQDKNAYVTLRLSLPSTSGSRADNFANDNFDAGKEDEYAVKRLDVLFFSENDAHEKVLETYYTTGVPFGNDAYLKMPDGWSVPKDENVTTQVTLPALKVNSATEKTVVVLVNSEALGLTYNKGTDKLDDFKAQIFNSSAVTIDAVAGNTKGWLMSNAPVVVGGTIQPFTTSDAYTTEAEAKAKPVDVYLERAVGKVTVSCPATNPATQWKADNTYTIPGGAAYAGATIKFTNWDLDITNKSMYLFHQYESTWTSGRYAGTGDPKRIYMAKDANYTKAYNGTAPNYDEWHTVIHTGTVEQYNNSKAARNLQMASNFARFEDDALNPAPALLKTMGGDAYCFENTFDVKNMSQDQTTRVLLQAVYDPDGAGTNYTAGQTFYMVGESGTPLNEADFIEKVKKAVKLTAGQSDISVDVSQVAAGSNGLVATADLTAGKVGVSCTGTALTATQITDAYKSLGKITVYKNGVCYYVARVKHFGSTYTPWGEEASAPTIGSTTYYDYFGTTDPLAENAYLGRYGIVRNNWYDLTLNTVSAPGSPVVPESGDVCDDVQNYYLQATIKILSWAKRSQSVDL